MRQNRHLFIILILCSIYLSKLNAQTTVTASGGNAVGSSGTVSYTVGQVVYTTDTSTIGSVAKGVQQPFEISIITEMETYTGIMLQCSVFPNPTAGELTLKVENCFLKSFSYKLFDISGHLLANKKLTTNETVISMNDLTPGSYFLDVIEDKLVVKAFKIIKR
ncbi:MAG: T9SS type A sorting domain-containing protein [Bacteroidota bacterium]